MSDTITWNKEKNGVTPSFFKEVNLVLWDLDGTLVDSGVGIKNSLRYAIKALGLKQPDEQTLNLFIGPPLRESFVQYLGLSPVQADQALAFYRQYYINHGLYECEPYPGLKQTLATLQEAGKCLTVATSKPWIFAHRVLAHHGLRRNFDTVFGCYRDGRLDTKSQVIQSVLAHYQGVDRLPKGRLLYGALQQPLVPEFRPLMIGDRFYDVQGAATHQVPTLGVSFGYGSTEELLNSGAIGVAHNLAQIEYLL
jgi:phosphoglycolate phosphatase